MRILPLALLAFCGLPALAADLSRVMAETNLEKRSEKALKYAETVIRQAQKAYAAGEMETVKAHLAEAVEAVQLSYDSLEETNKKARKKPKYFKRAEIKTRQLQRRVSGFERDMSFADRELLVPLQETLKRVNSDLLMAIMGARR